MTATQVPQTDPRRAARLLKVFRDVTKGGRTLTTAADARLFLEAIRTNEPPAACLEIITASNAAQNALRHSLRIDSTVSFIRSHVLSFVDYLSDPGVKMAYNGQLLHQILQLIIQPPVLWGNLFRAFEQGHFNEDDIRVFAWLCFELASIQGKDHDSIIGDISSALDKQPFKEAQDHRTRDLTYRIKKVIALRSSASPGENLETAGGRHDNDFADFREISIFPTSDEFYSSQIPFYRRASELAAIGAADRPRIHLDNQFRLLREDMLGELRDDLKVAIGKKRGRKSPQILSGLLPIGIDTGDEKRGRSTALLLHCYSGLEILRPFSLAKRKKFLEDNKGFLRHQSFGALCGDNNIVAFAFLVRDIDQLVKGPPVIALQFTSSEALARALNALQSPKGLRFVLVDTPVFAYQPVLECLQGIAEMPLEGGLLYLQDDDEESRPKPLELSPKAQVHVKLLEKMLERDSAAKALTIGSKSFRLDDSQTKSVLHALQSPIALIQGPPGTGKSFVGALAARILRDSSKRILVLSYTNHALDQFLEDLMNIGIPSDDIVRLGSKYTEKTEKLLLDKQLRSSVFKKTREAWMMIDAAKSDLADIREELQNAFNALVKGGSFTDLLDVLEFSDDGQDFYDAFALPEQEDGFQLAGGSRRVMSADYLIDRWAQGKDAGELRKIIPKASKHIWQLPIAQRQQHVETWARRLREEQIETVWRLAERFNQSQSQLETLFNESKCSLVQNKRVMGCTTTAAAKYKSLIKAARPDVVLVEEAGEILEAHVLTALHPATSQLILIGDHKQLRPKINNYTLSVEKGEGFDLNRSLFERLILQGHEHVTLQKQHRMHPEISHLVRQMTYPQLQDDEKTHKRAKPRGLQGRVSFINHSHPEDTADEIADRRDSGFTASKKNQFEAQMVLRLVRYLAQQEYKTNNIVVLTPYLGQLRLLRDMLSEENDPILNDMDSYELVRAGLVTAAAAKVKSGSGRIKLSTIDNYQGEESDIVIASMTRSNNKGDIGFMKAPERLNVLCSRARECLIMIGNMETFMKSSQGKQVWVPFFALLKEKEYLHDGVLVRCEQHPDKTALLESPKDFDIKCPDGGCDAMCNDPLSCGKHHCQRRCHPISNHSKVTCHERVKKTCERGHKYSVPCTDEKAGCGACLREDEDTRRRIQRDLRMEEERMLAQKRYAQELQQVKDELDHEKRRLKYAQEDEDHKIAIETARADVEALKQTRARAEAMKTAAEAAKKVPGAFPETERSWSPPSVPGSAREEWDILKKQTGESSAALDDVMDLIGLESVKEEFLSIKNRVDTSVLQNISLSKERFGCTLLGNPGTGKTTVARIYGKFLTSVGVIAGSLFNETTGSKLANMGVGGCQKMIEKILEDGGGVVFIDEAYQLSSGNSPGGKAVLDFLLAEVENLTGRIVFILAGYNKQMETFFAHNPGFPSRFPIQMKFDDYDDDELLQILQRQIKKKYEGQMKWEEDLYLRIVARRLGRGRGKEGFGNARAVENLLNVISGRQSNRIRRERKTGKKPDHWLFTKEDMIGPEPSNALGKCRAWIKLQKLIGLSSVKASVKALVDSIQTNYRRELAEEPIIEYSLNKVFLGSPGTGKTTVAKLYGQILVDLGLLSNGEVIVKNPADFTGAVLGGSEAQTKGILAATVGKVLVIDEAYGLFGGGGASGGSSSDPYKTAVVDTIVAEIQSVPGEDRCVLLLGYRDQMEEMFQNVNPGLSRRFPISSAFNFEDFSGPEMRQIFDLKIKDQAFTVTDQAKRVAMEMLDRARNRPHFGNAGEIDIILDQAKIRHQQRLSSNQTTQVSTLEAADFDEDHDRAERTDTDVAKLFEGAVGCEAIVEKLRGFQENVRTMKELGMDPKENIPFNFLFRGPPGTGKTTTARKMGKVFYDMGFLENAKVIECSATDLIGSYVGQTGPKVQQLLDKALGRVLFVDEAYRLAEGGFAKEAVDELVDCVTKDKYKGKLVMILAGYDNDINRLLSINPGMSSRFPEAIQFYPLEPRQCYDLLLQLVLRQKREFEAAKSTTKVLVDCLNQSSDGFREDVLMYFTDLSRLSSWASARDVECVKRSIFNEAMKSRQGTTIEVTEEIVTAELHKMLDERESRERHRGTFGATPELPTLQMRPPSEVHRPVQTQQETQKMTTAASESEETVYTPPDSPVEEEEEEVNNVTRLVNRDDGVSDTEWVQLELDKRSQESEEKKYRDLLEAQNKAADATREAILRSLLEEEAEKKAQEERDEERRRQFEARRKRAAAEAAAAAAARDAIRNQVIKEEKQRKREEEERRKAAIIGQCCAGFEWIKQEGGYRCAGGSHFVTDAQIASA